MKKSIVRYKKGFEIFSSPFCIKFSFYLDLFVVLYKVNIVAGCGRENMKRLKQGFTLIELLIVIAIIGILATTLAPKLREQLAKGKDAKVVAALGTGRTALNVISFEKTIKSDTNSITITYDDFRSGLDEKTKEIFKNDNGDIWVGGSRKDPKTFPNSPIKYSMNLTLSHKYKDNQQGDKSFNKNSDMVIDDDDALLFLSPRATPDGYVYSIEGKKWVNY